MTASSRGKPFLVVIEGNHDRLEWGGHVLREDVGITLLPNPTIMEIAGRRALITHGDAVGSAATRERLERRLARSRPFVALLRLLHPDWVAWLQPYTTTTRRQVALYGAGEGGGPKTRAPAIEAWACDALQQDGSLDFVIAAHVHMPARVEVEPGRHYLNAGDWITHFTYLVLAEGSAPEVRYWSEGKGAAVAQL